MALFLSIYLVVGFVVLIVESIRNLPSILRVLFWIVFFPFIIILIFRESLKKGWRDGKKTQVIIAYIVWIILILFVTIVELLT